MYKADDRGACMSIYDNLEESWDEETGSGNRVDLAELIDLIHNAPVDNFKTFLQEHFYYDHLINQIAINLLTANASTYYHNYFLYHDVNGNGKWMMFPWDLDKTCSVYAWTDYTVTSNSCEHDNPAIEKAFLNQEVMADIRARITALKNQFFNIDFVWPVIDSLANSISASVIQDVSDDVPDFETFVEQVQTEKNFFTSRYNNLINQFDHLVSSFTVMPTPGVYPSDFTLNWSPAVDPDGGVVRYNLYISTGPCFEPEFTQIFSNLTETFYQVTNMAPGNYTWKVTAVDGDREVEAYESNMPLTIGQETPFPCNITSNTTFTLDNSPYILDCNAVIASGAVLSIDPGVEIRIKPGFHILVNGAIQSNGTAALPVRIVPESTTATWDSIAITGASAPCWFKYTIFNDGVVHAESSNVTFGYCEFNLINKQLNDMNVLVGHYWGTFAMHHCIINGNDTGQGLEIGYTNSATVTHTELRDINDPVEFITINSGQVMHCLIKNSDDDGIDFNNCQNITVSDNVIINCNDNGLSFGNEFAGPTQNINVFRNLILNCKNGITVKDGSVINMDRNTFANNRIGIKAWQKNPGMGGGTVYAKNSIFYNTVDSVLEVDEFSLADLKYCLANTELLPGANNLFNDPAFVDPSDDNFRLTSLSPCLNSGDPDSPADPDNTRADMGAFFYNLGVYDVVINEINYNPAPDFATEDWIELYNTENADVDISGWIFKDDDDEHNYTFPSGTMIPAGGYLVACRDKNLFSALFPGVTALTGNFSFGLGSSGDQVRLFNEGLVLIDSLTFDDEDPWPSEPDGDGPTLELKNPFLDNTLGQNWCASSGHGTPGALNSCFAQSVDDETLNDPVQIFPVPFHNTISIDAGQHQMLALSVSTVTGQVIRTIQFSASDGRMISTMDMSFLKPGFYMVTLDYVKNGKNHKTTRKLVKN